MRPFPPAPSAPEPPLQINDLTVGLPPPFSSVFLPPEPTGSFDHPQSGTE